MKIDIQSLAAWSEPKRVNTKLGPKLLQTAQPTEAFSQAWKASKQALKDAGLSWSKDQKTGAWAVCWWQSDTETARKQDAAIAQSRASDSNIEFPAPDGLSYLPYQKAGIQWAGDRSAALIADEMGLGKTIQALGVINSYPDIHKVLVICPASLKLNWSKEAKRWLVRPISIGIAGRTWPDADFVICNYDIATKYHAQLHCIKWDLVILDEAHYCKNPKTQRTQAVFGKWDKSPDKAKPALQSFRKLVLTGTPILNRPIESQPMLGFLEPAEFGNFWRFAKRYAAARQSGFGWDLSGASNLDELQRRLRSTVMIRRMKADVLTELPPKRRQVIELEANGLSYLVAKEQDTISTHESNLERVKEAVEMAKILEDKEAYAAAIYNLRKAQMVAFESASIVRHEIALAKVPYVIEHVSNAVENGQVVLFAHHRDVIEKIIFELTERGISTVKVIGGMTDNAKNDAVEAFQAGKAQVFVGNIQAAGVGLTLTRSSHVVFAELDWVPATMTQAEDRTHRIGQKASVLVQHLVLEGSLDQRMARALVRKQDIADRTLDNPLEKLEENEPVTVVTVTDNKPVSTDASAKMYTVEEISVLLGKLRYLASVCDGATAKDGSGFNGLDSKFGKALAARPFLSQRQAAIADRLCHKYRRQLNTFIEP